MNNNEISDEEIFHLIAEEEQGTPFLSLREFMLLADPSYTPPRRIHTSHMEAHSWVEYYECAKKNYEKFGMEGPPVGTWVRMIQTYGDFGNLRVINRSQNSIYLDRELTAGAPNQEMVIPRRFWWAIFREKIEGEKYCNTDKYGNKRI